MTQYAAVNFDVHEDPSLYAKVHRILGFHALPNGSETSVLIRYEDKDKVVLGLERINQEEGRKAVTYKVRRTHPEEEAEVRGDIVAACKLMVQKIGKSLLDSIEAMETKFNEKIDDINEHLSKRRSRITAAKRDIQRARSLALLFLIEGDAADAFEVQERVIAAQEAAFGDLKAKNAQEIAVLKAAAKEREKTGTSK